MSGQGQDPSKDNTYNILWIMGTIFVVGWGVWHFYGVELKTAFLWVKRMEAKLLISIFADNAKMQDLYSFVENLSPEGVSIDEMQDAAREIGKFYLYPVIALFVFFAVTIYRGHVHLRFNKTYDLQRLMLQEQKIYPQIAVVSNVDMMNQDMDSGPWAMSATPMQFSKKYKLLDIECLPNPKNVWAADGIYKATVRVSRAERLFISQLGPLWAGVDRLPEHTKALFTLFACRINNDSTSARALTNELARTAAGGKINYTMVPALLKKYKDTAGVKRVIEKHAYVSTVMIMMLTVARLDGVLATADFLWLKPVDRRMWYILNTVGRQTAPSEVAGIYAHFYCERELKQALKTPMVTNAVLALQGAIDMIVYEPDPGDEIIDRRSI